MSLDLLALRSLLSILAVFAVTLLLAAWLVESGHDAGRVMVPPPEGVAAQFVQALKARRYEGAVNRLSRELRQQWGAEQLDGLVRSLEGQGWVIDDAYGRESRVQGDDAIATVSVKLVDGTEENLEFSLSRENGLWRVASLDPLVRDLPLSAGPAPGPGTIVSETPTDPREGR